jgi:hypothetical protein
MIEAKGVDGIVLVEQRDVPLAGNRGRISGLFELSHEARLLWRQIGFLLPLAVQHFLQAALKWMAASQEAGPRRRAKWIEKQ